MCAQECLCEEESFAQDDGDVGSVVGGEVGYNGGVDRVETQLLLQISHYIW